MERSNDEDISDFLDNFPLLYRSIQAATYVSKNPPQLEGGVKNQGIFNYVSRYMFDLLKKFFSGSGLYIYKEDTTIDDTTCEFFVGGPSLKESDIEGIFGVLGNVLKSVFVSPMVHSFAFRAEGDNLYFLLSSDHSGFDSYLEVSDVSDYDKVCARRQEQELKQFTEHPELYIVL